MDEETDYEAHEAVQEQVIPGVTPGALLDAMDNPDDFARIARADLYVQMAHMRRQASHPEMSNAQRMDYAKFLARMGKVDAPQRADGELDHIPMISIVLPNSGATVAIGAAPPPRVEKDITPDQELGDVDEIDTGFGSQGGKQSQAVLP